MELPGASFFLGCSAANLKLLPRDSLLGWNDQIRIGLFLYIADFGLSRSFQTESRSHVSTLVAGTPGYLDPLCFKTNELNEKSDIYSFGVVLLEIITGKTAISESEAKRVHVSDWVISILKSTNDVSNVVDARMHGDFDANSVWKIVELAMASVSQNVAERPNMQQIVTGLKECLQREESNKNHQ